MLFGGIVSAFVLGLAAVAEAKEVWNSDFSIIEDKMRTLPAAKMIKRNTWTVTVPTRCWDAALENDCPISELHVFEAWFDDAPKPWLICRCRNAPFTEAQFMTEIGRLPVAIRQRTRYFMLFRGSGSAYSFDNDVVFKGNISPTMLLHETAHAFDGGRSTQQQFIDAIKKDTCWADNYAKSAGEAGRWWEPWAQTFVLYNYIARIGNPPKSLNCLNNQLWAIFIQTFDEINAGYVESRMRPYGDMRKRT
ncbi:hypothetical protein EX30DRAFT_392125 [Ascodesmis nigricans]|uniref:Lysine-specific metallo-endopeptidase domain-containing protein n=1 Tax=Ascodesmis nigricans TaxID=341454 RepID=A0A4S2N686_9PEZI|nr:hypothetical protein EX30DRAFT_392125 [Ascodesmis nigricans]